MASKLYVGNLNYATTEQALRSAFESYGQVVSVKIIQGKGFGFVEYGSDSEATAAMEAMNGKDLDGRPLRVNEARPPEKKDFGGGGFKKDREFNSDRGRGGFKRY
jgi:cold-inducible RNA-binding protein